MREAYHRILFPDGTTLEGPLVLVFREGRPESWHPLAGEEAATVWRGGAYRATLADKNTIQKTI